MNKIEYQFFDSPMGQMVAGATESGICFLEWEDRGGIERILKRVTKNTDWKKFKLKKINLSHNCKKN